MPHQRYRFLAAFLAPAFVMFSLFVAWPGVRALIYSLQKWDGLGDAEWAGLANFERLLSDPLFYAALRHNLILAFAGGSLTLCLALFFASLLHRRIRGAGLFRVVFFFPNVIATVAVALVWLLLYSTTDFGMVNAFLGVVQNALGAAGIHVFEGVLPYAFTDSTHLIWALVPMMVWTATGFYMVLFIAAMEGIPEEFYDAAKLDGASPLSQFWHVTLPMIREVIVVGIVFLIISSMKFFDSVWVMESQYPTNDSHVLATLLYQKVFSEYNVGYGAAVAVMLFLIVFAATLFTFRLSRKEALEF
jgi:ABC-type sugar transport system permease subunit